MRGSIAAILALLSVACADGTADGSGEGGGGGESWGEGNGGSGAASACGPVVQGTRCLESGWCWDAPRPQAVQFAAVDATPDGTSAWAVGSFGGAFRRCGGAWVPIETGSAATLFGVWHPEPGVAIAVGEEGTVLRWDGQAWLLVEAPTHATLRAVWGAAPNDVWIGGDADDQGVVLLHFDGTNVTRSADVSGYAFDILSIDGRSAGDVFAVGGTFENDASMHFDGTVWTALPSGHGYPNLGPFSQVVALDDGTTFANYAGFNTSRIFRRDGADWVEVFYRGDANALHALFQDSSGHAAIVESGSGSAGSHAVLRFDADAFSPTSETMPALPVAAWAHAGTDEAWAVGGGSTLLGHAAGAWSQVPELVAFPPEPIFVGGLSHDDLWVVTSAEAAHRTAEGWSIEALPVEWASAATVDLAGRPWVLGGNGDVIYREGDTWTTVATTGGTYDTFVAMAPDDVWVTTYSAEPMHFYGTVWEIYSSYCAPFHDPTQSGWLPGGRRFRRAPDGVVWLVGERGAFAFDAHQCKQLMGPGGTTFDSDALVDIAWTPAGDLWAVSWKGTLYHRENDFLVSHANPLAGIVTESAQIDQLVATPSGKLRIIYSDTVETDWNTYIATIDPSSGKMVGPPLAAPAHGVVWTPDESHALVAIDGGVLEYGYAN